MSGLLDALMLVYIAGAVMTAALGIVASDRLRSDWLDVVILAIGWPVVLLAYLTEGR